MLTEEHISQKVEEAHEKALLLRGQLDQQRLEARKLTEYIHQLFQQDRNAMVDLFWELFRSRRGPYEAIFWGIVDQHTPESIRLASHIMAEPENHLQDQAAVVLYKAKDPYAVPYLIKALEYKDYNTVSRSAVALGHIGDIKAEPYLIEIVDKYNADWVYDDGRIDDAYPIIRANTFNALCMLNTPAAQAKILEAVFHDRDIQIQQRAVRHLTGLKEKAIPYLEKLLTTQPNMIDHLIRALPEHSIPYLKEMSNNGNSNIAALAKEYLEKIS